MDLVNIMVIGALVAIVLGIIAAFFGYRVYRILCALVGFGIGAALGVALASTLTVAADLVTPVTIALGLVGGLIGAALAWFLVVVFVFLSGAAVGALLGSTIAVAVAADGTLQLVMVVALAAVVGIIAVVLQKPFIILTTAFAGAQMIVSGVSQLLNIGSTNVAANPLTQIQPGVLPTFSQGDIVMGISWLVLGIVAAVVQFKFTAKTVKPDSTPVSASAHETQAELDTRIA